MKPDLKAIREFNKKAPIGPIARHNTELLLNYISDLEAVAGAAKENFKRTGCKPFNCTYCTASNCFNKELGMALAKLKCEITEK